MIARLRGILELKSRDQALIDVGGVGYLAFCSARTLAALPQGGAPVVLEIETHVREDHIHLYGFIDRAERDWFRLLITVQGVGARVALGILSILSPDDLARAVAAQDRVAIAKANGVGAKLAARIAGELRDKAAGIMLDGATVSGHASAPTAGTMPEGSSPPETAKANGAKGPDGPLPDDARPMIADAVSALVNLGYGRSEAFAAIARAGAGAAEADAQNGVRGGDVATLIRAGLKELSR